MPRVQSEQIDAETQNAVESPPFDGAVKVRVVKFGAGKVSKGIHVAEEGDKYADRDEELWVDSDTAGALEENGFAEKV
mgnify:FL=1